MNNLATNPVTSAEVAHRSATYPFQCFACDTAWKDIHPSACPWCGSTDSVGPASLGVAAFISPPITLTDLIRDLVAERLATDPVANPEILYYDEVRTDGTGG